MVMLKIIDVCQIHGSHMFVAIYHSDEGFVFFEYGKTTLQAAGLLIRNNYKDLMKYSQIEIIIAPPR
jgi:hypothetical protein